MKHPLATIGFLTIAATTISGASAQTSDAKIADLSFLVGHWDIIGGRISLYGARPRGTVDIEMVGNSSGLLIQSHGVAIGVEGQRVASSEGALLIYLDGGILNAEYVSRSKSVHYKATSLVAGHSVTFTSDARPNGALLGETYELQEDGRVVANELVQNPGQNTFGVNESEELKKPDKQ